MSIIDQLNDEQLVTIALAVGELLRKQELPPVEREHLEEFCRQVLEGSEQP